MAPVFKVHEQSTAIMERRKGKRKVDDLNEDLEESDVPPGPANKSPPKKKRNKQRILMLSSRGITHRMRHFMNDLEALLPHVKKGVCVKLPTRSFAHVVLTWGIIQIRSWIRRTTSTCYPNSQIYTRVTTRCTLRRVGMRTCTFGRPRRRMDRASSCTYRTCTRWTSSK